MARRGVFIVDANVLIDYLTVDASVLALIVNHLGPIHVPRRVLAEVKRQPLGDVDCDVLGLTIITEEEAELQAALGRHSALAFPDRLILAISSRRQWIAITNDRCLRRILKEADVPLRWGLEMMLDLITAGCLPKARALAIAEGIAAENRRYLPAVIEEFRRKATALQVR